MVVHGEGDDERGHVAAKGKTAREKKHVLLRY